MEIVIQMIASKISKNGTKASWSDFQAVAWVNQQVITNSDFYKEWRQLANQTKGMASRVWILGVYQCNNTGLKPLTQFAIFIWQMLAIFVNKKNDKYKKN